MSSKDPHDQPHTGAFRQTTHAHSLRSVLKALIDEDPDPTRNKSSILEKMYAHYRDHVEMYEHGVVVDYWGENNFNALVRQRGAPPMHVHYERREQAEATARAQVKSAVHRKAVRLLLDEIVPGLNKPLRDCTIAECRDTTVRLSRWTRILNFIGESKNTGTVGEFFTEDQLQEVDQGA